RNLPSGVRQRPRVQRRGPDPGRIRLRAPMAADLHASGPRVPLGLTPPVTPSCRTALRSPWDCPPGTVPMHPPRPPEGHRRTVFGPSIDAVQRELVPALNDGALPAEREAGVRAALG